MKEKCMTCGKEYVPGKNEGLEILGMGELESDSPECPECISKRLDESMETRTKLYCTQNDGDCETCSLVNYGRDCMNNPI